MLRPIGPRLVIPLSAQNSTPSRLKPKVGFSPAAMGRSKKPRAADHAGALFACAKSDDLAGAFAAFESAKENGGCRLTTQHYNALIHLISSSDEASYADARKVFDHMVAAGAAPSEATLTSLARAAAADGSADEAFAIARDMKARFGLSPRLRSFSPVLAAFCGDADTADKAYEVEREMEVWNLTLEELELSMLLSVSVNAGRAEKVYEYLQKLRKAADGGVMVDTAEVVENWFRTNVAAEIEAADVDIQMVKEKLKDNGGGWHGVGWLGKGRWNVKKTEIEDDGVCGVCGTKLVGADIGRAEMDKFAKSVSGLAFKREVETDFSSFQDWLQKHGEYKFVIDAANIALYQQNFADGGFSLSQLEAVVRELRERTGGAVPLIVLHNKRFLKLMEVPSNRELLQTWEREGALYRTPTGSNDDWYWLYAAIKLNCFLVTNDEMRDHIFELIENSFFLRWKKRHQVRYTFMKGNVVLEMPPLYSAVIQESENGSWHVPIRVESEGQRMTWICSSRACSSGSQDQDNENEAVDGSGRRKRKQCSP